MNRDEIKKTISTSVEIVLNKKFGILDDNIKLITDLNIESIQFIDIIFEIEKIIKVELDMNLLAMHLAKTSKLHLSQVKVVDLVEFIEQTL